MWIELRDIHKHYGAIKANNGVNLSIAPGTIHGILGENGAGKSTLMKILAGYSQKTSGTVLVDNCPVTYKTPAQAAELGIGLLYQDPLDFPLLSILDNFMLGQTTGIANKKKTFRKILKESTDFYKFPLHPDATVKSLSISERQQLEVLRLLARGIQVLILDEPTTGISSLQKKTLFKALKQLAAQGKSVILVSHKLEDVEALCDKITVLRQGTVAGNMVRPFDTNSLLAMMFGTPPVYAPRTSMKTGETVFEMRRVSASGGRTGLKDCNLAMRQGEVVGLAGLEGSGQEIFLKIAAGLKRLSRGSIYLQGMSMNGKDHHTFRNRGVAYLPASRLEEGLISGLNIAEHLALQDKQKGLFVDRRDAFQKASQSIAKFQIKGKPESFVEFLSGGNQQRLLLAFLPPDPALLLLGNPTRGLDMESVHWIWQHLHQYCARRTCIAFSSPDLDEIMMHADRVLVFFDGAIIKDTRTDQTDAYELGRAIAGFSQP